MEGNVVNLKCEPDRDALILCPAVPPLPDSINVALVSTPDGFFDPLKEELGGDNWVDLITVLIGSATLLTAILVALNQTKILKRHHEEEKSFRRKAYELAKSSSEEQVSQIRKVSDLVRELPNLSNDPDTVQLKKIVDQLLKGSIKARETNKIFSSPEPIRRKGFMESFSDLIKRRDRNEYQKSLVSDKKSAEYIGQLELEMKKLAKRQSRIEHQYRRVLSKRRYQFRGPRK